MSSERESLDANLSLLDRQVVDTDGRMVCKVDDLQVRRLQDGGWGVTALLTGPAVWLPRVSTWLHERWLALSAAESDREYPFELGLDAVAEVSSEVRLNRERQDLLTRDFGDGPDRSQHLSRLLGARVRDRTGRDLGKVLDARLELPGAGSVREPGDHYLLSWLLVGKGAPGTLLGYDRREVQGPWLVNKLVRALHRGSGMIRIEDVDIDWEGRIVTTSSGLEPVTAANAPGKPLRDR